MDTDTIFSILTNDERIVGKYRNNSWRKGIEFIAILTNQRLLTHSKQTVCYCCYHHSSYSAISLESIHRIVEHPIRSNILLCLVLWIICFLIAIAGITVSVFVAKNESIRIIGIIVSTIPLVIMSMVIFVCLCYHFDGKFIELYGTFGTIKIFFKKQEARLFENHLSEQISQVKLRIQQSSVPSTSISTYYLSNEILTMDEQMTNSNRF